jgi:hypothetical protein
VQGRVIEPTSSPPRHLFTRERARGGGVRDAEVGGRAVGRRRWTAGQRTGLLRCCSLQVFFLQSLSASTAWRDPLGSTGFFGRQGRHGGCRGPDELRCVLLTGWLNGGLSWQQFNTPDDRLDNTGPFRFSPAIVVVVVVVTKYPLFVWIGMGAQDGYGRCCGKPGECCVFMTIFFARHAESCSMRRDAHQIPCLYRFPRPTTWFGCISSVAVGCWCWAKGEEGRQS